MDNLSGQLIYQSDSHKFQCHGMWVIGTVSELKKQLAEITLPRKEKVSFSGLSLEQLDSAGALFLFHLINQLNALNNQVKLENLKKAHEDIYDIIRKNEGYLEYAPPPPEKKPILYKLGKQTMQKVDQGRFLLKMVGSLSNIIWQAGREVRRFHIPSIIQTIYDTGVTALPIIGLLSFLIGIVLAYQMGLQLETYGANIYIAFLSGMAIFREFSPLITAIIVAGRTSSAFTAQIGSMKINEEIDALYTMGLSPIELLVLPRVIGLLLVFPLLIFWSVLFATLGAMLMSRMMLDVTYMDFLTRLQNSVGIQQFALGLYKAPCFAILIAIVGCVQGLMVKATADSIGRQTTKSVVQALFLIIVADAIYSIIYSWLEL